MSANDFKRTFSAMTLIWINDAHGLIRQRHKSVQIFRGF